MKKTLILLLLFSVTAVLSAQTYNVTFRVNMNEVADPFTTPEVNGNFNGWCGGCNPMTDADLDGIWEVTIALAPGIYEYKFAYDAWTGQENLIPGTFCTVTNFGFTNRSLEVVASDIDLGTVCWGSCDNCGLAPISNITFQVNMNGVAEPFTTPEVNGNFNGWCGGCAPMSDANSDGIWDVTIALAAGTYEYKFAYDSWTGQETLTEGSPCTVTNFGFTNRTITVAGDAVLEPVVWATCDAINTVITPGGSTTICHGSNVNFTAAEGYTSYQWKKNEINIAGATSSNYVATAAGNYSVLIYSGTAYATSVASTLIVSKPAPKITVVGSLDICLTGAVLLKGKVGIGSTYQWYKNGVLIVGAPLNLIANTIGSYKLKETTTAGCVKSKTVTVTSSCKESAIDHDAVDFTIFPNPVKDVFTVTSETEFVNGENVSIIIYTSTGIEIFHQLVNTNNGIINETINLSNNISSGMYLVKIVGNDLAITKSLIIE